MKQLKVVLWGIVVLFVWQCKTHCNDATAKDVMGTSKYKNEKIIDVKGQKASKVFYQEWIAGVQYGGSGVNLYIQTSLIGQNKGVVAYFRGQKQDLEQINCDGQQFLIGRFKMAINQSKDFVMSDDPVQEVGNADKLLNLAAGLDKNEAIIAYEKSGQLYHITLKNISEVEQLLYPSPPPPHND